MKLFPQIALVSAIAISGNAMAMQALDDESLSAATGQDGITIQIKPPTAAFGDPATGPFAATGGMAGVISIDHIYVHDKGGLAAADGGTDTSGAIVLDGFKIAGDGPIVVKIDADGNGVDPLLNINVALPTNLIIRTGDISVASSNRVTGTAITNTTLRGIDAANQNLILDSIDVSMGGATLNIQLGAEAQGAMIVAAGTITDGLNINGLTLRDSAGVASAPGNLGSGTGAIYVGGINVRDNGGSDLTIATNIDVSDQGLVLTMTGATATDILLTDVRLGTINKVAGVLDVATSAATLGDIEIVGLNSLGTQISISGH